MQPEATVMAAELELMTSATRRNRPRVRALLHEDFVEIGRSGRRWSRDDIIAALADEDPRPAPEVDEWTFVSWPPDLVLATYRVRSNGGASRHASVWDIAIDPPRLRFHQGTVVPGDA